MVLELSFVKTPSQPNSVPCISFLSQRSIFIRAQFLLQFSLLVKIQFTLQLFIQACWVYVCLSLQSLLVSLFSVFYLPFRTELALLHCFLSQQPYFSSPYLIYYLSYGLEIWFPRQLVVLACCINSQFGIQSFLGAAY